jgi:hypothetical protein
MGHAAIGGAPVPWVTPKDDRWYLRRLWAATGSLYAEDDLTEMADDIRDELAAVLGYRPHEPAPRVTQFLGGGL